jgi:hypothetical protein
MAPLRSRASAVLPVAVVAALAFGSTACRRGSGSVGSFSSLRVESPAMRLDARDLEVKVDRGRQEWSFTLVCQEPDGCHGAVRVELLYVSRGLERRLEATPQLDLERGGGLRIGRTVRPIERVDRVERVTVTVLSRGRDADAPRPTPRS